MKKHNRFGSLSLAMLAVLFLAAAPNHAQETAKESAAAQAPAESAGLSVTTSRATIQVSGNAAASRTGLAESITFSGNIVIDATVVTDPALPTGVTVFVDGKGIRGVGSATGTVYVNSFEANVSRLFRPTDKITLTFAFFEDKKGSFRKSKTGVVTLTLTYDEKTRKLTRATGVVATLDAAATGNS